MRYLKSFNEALHINEEVDRLGNELVNLLKDKKFGDTYIWKNDGSYNFKISEIYFNIKKTSGPEAYVDINKCKELKDGMWRIYIKLSSTGIFNSDEFQFNLATLKHELNHAFRLTKIGKKKSLDNLHHLKTGFSFKLLKDKQQKNDIEEFFHIIYLANDEEINSSIIQAYQDLKDSIIREKRFIRSGKLDKETFIWLLTSTSSFLDAEDLKNFSCEKNFKNLNKNQINKFFYIIENKKKDIDRVMEGPFSKIRLIGKLVKDLFNKEDLTDDGKNYNPKKGAKFYDNWINKQGVKLERRLYALYEHFSNEIE